MHLKIYQLKEDKLRKYGFMDYDYAIKHGFSLDDYEVVWEEDISDDTELDDIFARFNINHPTDYRGHSLSESDIVELDGKKFYCDMVGWKEL